VLLFAARSLALPIDPIPPSLPPPSLPCSYNEPIRVEALTQGICDLALNFAEDGDEKKMSRPFGVALLLAGYDDKGPQLFFSDPSGTFTQFKAKVNLFRPPSLPPSLPSSEISPSLPPSLPPSLLY
jgi:hypothetical protein